MKKFILLILIFFIITLIGCNSEYTQYPNWKCEEEDGIDFEEVHLYNKVRKKITISTEYNDFIIKELEIEDIYIEDDDEDNYSIDTSDMDDEISSGEETSFYVYFEPVLIGLKKAHLIIKTNNKKKKIDVEGVGIN